MAEKKEREKDRGRGKELRRTFPTESNKRSLLPLTSRQTNGVEVGKRKKNKKKENMKRTLNLTDHTKGTFQDSVRQRRDQSTISEKGRRRANRSNSHLAELRLR